MTRVDVVIPIHDETRAIERAVGSVLLGGPESDHAVSVTVVCHNMGADAIRERLRQFPADQVRVVDYHDGIHSPAGPKNHGFEITHGEYVFFLDSDDFVEPGAIAAWRECAVRHEAAVVIAPEKHQDGRRIRTPPVRALRGGVLDPLRDRMAYRTAPLALMRRSALERHAIAFTTGLATGEDHLFSLPLWFSGERCVYARSSPSYVVGNDAEVRVTFVHRSLDEEFRALGGVLESEWFTHRPLRDRRAIAVKFVRVHVFGAVLARTTAGSWTPDEARVATSFLAQLERSAPGYRRTLSIADCALLEALDSGDRSPADIDDLAQSRRKFLRARSLVTRHIGTQFAIDGPLRIAAASVAL